MSVTTLCYIEQDDSFLMLLRNKKPHDPNAGKWLGVGGKVEPGETAEQCAVREIREETGLTALRLLPCGVVHFFSDVWEDEQMHVFLVTKWEGSLIECNEGELHWIPKQQLPHLPMWEGDAIFLQRLLTGDVPFDIELHYEGDRLTQCVVHDTPADAF